MINAQDILVARRRHAGRRLRVLYAAHHDRMAELRSLLGASDEDLVGLLSARLAQGKDAERTVRDLKQELAVSAAAALVAGPGHVLAEHWPSRDLTFLQGVAREVARLDPERVVLLTCGEEKDGAFVIGAGELGDADLKAVGQRVADLLGGRGGGSKGIFQGKGTRLSRRESAADLIRGHGLSG